MLQYTLDVKFKSLKQNIFTIKIWIECFKLSRYIVNLC